MNTKHNTIETMYRKVALSERLPKKIGFYFIISANGIKRSYWFNGSKFFTDENVRVIKYWLEETPSLEAENKELREMLSKILIHVDWSYENWTSDDGNIIKKEIEELLNKTS